LSYGEFTDRNRKPEESEVRDILAIARPAWQEIVDYIENMSGAKGEFKYYGKNYGWALRFNRSGKSLAAIYPLNNAFTVQIILNPAQAEKALEQDLSPEIRQTIRETREIHEGKWIFIKVASGKHIDDVKRLLTIRGAYTGQ
jgi:hypothetical protein